MGLKIPKLVGHDFHNLKLSAQHHALSYVCRISTINWCCCTAFIYYCWHWFRQHL